MKPSTLWLLSSACVIGLAIQAAPSNINPLATKRLKPIAKGASQLLNIKLANTLALIVAPQPSHTNDGSIRFYSGLDYNSNHLVYLQSSSHAKGLPFTNVASFTMGDSNVVVTPLNTNQARYYRLQYDSVFTIAPSFYITNNIQQK